MVDFSERGEIKRWLDGIGPAEQRREVAVVLAARAALRVMPLMGRHKEKVHDSNMFPSLLFLSSFRKISLVGLLAKYPAGLAEYRSAFQFARQRIGPISDQRAAFSVAAIQSAFSTALAAISYPKSANQLTIAVSTHAASAIVAAGAAADALALRATTSDAYVIDQSRSGESLAGAPLWINGVPDWVLGDWQTMKSALLDANEGWEAWTDWYEARLAGDAARPPNEALEIARATIPEDIWKQGPAAVNAEIMRLIAEYAPGASDTEQKSPEEGIIENHIHDQSEFEPILATRAALRILPILSTDTRADDSYKSIFVLSVFHALAVAWATVQFSSFVNAKWSTAAARDVEPYGPTSGSAAHHVGTAAAHAAFAAGSTLPTVAKDNASRAETQVLEAARVFGRNGAESIIKLANSSDENDIAPGVSPSQIAQIALWPGRDPPEFMSDLWEFLKEGLRSADEGWDVWIDWYEARLDGRLRPQEVELAYVNFIRNVSPIVSARAANDEIRRLIELYNPGPNLAIGDSQPIARTGVTEAGHTLTVAITASMESLAAPTTSAPTVVDWDFFVSYAAEDEALAREVVGVIESAGYSTFAQFKDFPVGANFVREMNHGLAGGRRVIVLYSQFYQESDYCQAEWSAVFTSDPISAKGKLIAFLVARTVLNPLARSIIYKTLIGLNGAQRRAAILDAIKSRPPSDIPAPKPAALEPIFKSGRFTLPTKAAEATLSGQSIPAALKALSQTIAQLADAADEETNIDKRSIRRLREIGTNIPKKRPNQTELFRLGHEYDELIAYRNIVVAAWPDILAARYTAMTLGFERTLLRFPRWVDFTREPPIGKLTPALTDEIAIAVGAFAQALRPHEGDDLVDQDIPDMLNRMAGPLADAARRADGLPDPVELANELLAHDVLESMNNTLKRVAEVALVVLSGAGKAANFARKKAGSYAKEFGEGTDESLRKSSRKVGEAVGPAVVKLLKRSMYTAVGLSTLTYTGPTLLAWLTQSYPQMFSWLEQVHFFLK